MYFRRVLSFVVKKFSETISSGSRIKRPSPPYRRNAKSDMDKNPRPYQRNGHIKLKQTTYFDFHREGQISYQKLKFLHCQASMKHTSRSESLSLLLLITLRWKKQTLPTKKSSLLIWCGQKCFTVKSTHP